MSRATGGRCNRVQSVRARFKYLFLLATVLGGTYLIWTLNKSTDLLINVQPSGESWRTHRHNTLALESEDRFMIKTEGCTIPALKPLDDSVKKFVAYPKNMKPCPNADIALLGNLNKHIWIRKENIHYYNITNATDISCCYQSFYRPSSVKDISSSGIDDRVQYDECIYFSDLIEVKHEFVKVSCKVGERKVYEQFFLFAPHKEFMEHDDKKEMPKTKSAYNVLVLGIDAVSRLNFHRTMPKTVAYLKEKGAIELKGYNKVGDNTFPNLIPMLMGIKDTELKKTCLPHGQATFDNCPFVWEWFKQAGYYTALGEDSSFLGTFNYVKVGFSTTPTDYYIHTFINEAERHAGTNKDFNSFLCMNDKYFYQVLLDYIEDLTMILRSSRLFGFFWEVTMSHDYLNYPMVMDSKYETFLKKLETSEYLNDTIIFLVSDHGIRWGEIRSTKQGRLEERLPFVFILAPQSFRDNYTEAYNNLKLNSKRLTTPFDIHATLTDLIGLDNIKNEVIIKRTKENYIHDRSISLFLPIPLNRTCETAGIDDHWCTCHTGTALSKNSPEAIEAGTELVRNLNLILQDQPQCARLTLAEILEVTEMEAGKPEDSEDGWREFMVMVRTLPGDAVFEATLRRDKTEWGLAGTVSRLNLYGQQSHCVHQYQLKLYCYCE